MAPAAPLVALQDATLGFGGAALFERASFGLAPGDKVCLVGRNGTGKSTLLRVLAGDQPLDHGERFLRPGARVSLLPQEPGPAAEPSVALYVAAGLDRLEAATRAAKEHRVPVLIERLGLEGDRSIDTLSGGEGRRAALARALVGDPEVLLLDEPTNHLDLPTIEWLEAELTGFGGALLVVSHDRAFLRRVARASLWLDRGRLLRHDRPFEEFEPWAETLREREAEAQHKLQRRIVREEHWLRHGITARRRRNQGRLERLAALRQQRAQWLRAPGQIALKAATGPAGGDLVIEAERVSKSLVGEDGREIPIIRDFSTRIRRGDRIGVIGPNGSGKTTLVCLLIGELTPDQGRLRLGARVQPLYFDQSRESLEPDATLWETLVPGGGDSLMVRGHQRHVVSYLRDFLFAEWQVRQPVKSLSGGERNRLMLARLFARSGTLMVLDEPTNDLDMDTLDLLVEGLSDYQGTLLLVSHDRDFLDRLVNGLLVLDGSGRIEDYVGGYSDYARARQEAAQATGESKRTAQRREASTAAQVVRRPVKLGYQEARELAALPGEIEQRETEIKHLESELTDPELYRRDRRAFEQATSALEAARRALAQAEARWIVLEEKQERLRHDRAEAANLAANQDNVQPRDGQ